MTSTRSRGRPAGRGRRRGRAARRARRGGPPIHRKQFIHKHSDSPGGSLPLALNHPVGASYETPHPHSSPPSSLSHCAGGRLRAHQFLPFLRDRLSNRRRVVHHRRLCQLLRVMLKE